MRASTVDLGCLTLTYDGRHHPLGVHTSTLSPLIGGFDCRDMSVEDACELGKRAIYHATFRDAVSGGTVSGTS